MAVLAATLLSVRPVLTQARPTAAQAEAILRERSDLAAQVTERIGASGLTPEQIRARLRAEGYPEDLLDPYLGRGTTARGTQGTPGREVFRAMGELGLADADDLAELSRLAGRNGVRGDSSRWTGTVDADEPGAESDSTLSRESATIFGLALFRESSSLFLPNVDGPVDAGYRLGPGDQLVLTLSGDVEESHTVDVTRDGSITIPRIGQIAVANLTMGELESMLYTRLGRVYGSVRRDARATTRLGVTVARLRSNQVFVTGDVIAPGSYRVTSAGTALTALYAAGGPTDRGSLRRIEVRRAGRTVSTLDVYDYLLRGDASRDVRLQQGDIVFVPIHGGRVRVDGAVERPATYELLAGESVADAIAAAGGLRATAGGRRLVVERILPFGERGEGRDRAVIDVPLGANGAVPTLPAADGDVVRVPGIGDRVRGRIRVNGHVWSPGPQGLTQGLTLSDALRRAGGVKPDAYLGTVLVSRLEPDSTRSQLRAMLRDTTGSTLEPLMLREDDEITVFDRTSFRAARHVTIGGAVRDGGRFPFHDGMTLRDLVLLAGGLTEGASLQEAEIARLPGDRDARVTATTLRVPLDSGYRFERDSAALLARAEVVLEPHDNVLILRSPTWRDPESVQLTGEVLFPGRYTLLRRGERLSDLIRRAGGLTPDANVDGAFLARLMDTTRSVIGADNGEVRVSGDSGEVTNVSSVERDTTPPRIRVGVNVRSALARSGVGGDVPMMEGDSLHIPRQRHTVEILGEVNAPTARAYDGARRLQFYVNAAGGPTDVARPRQAYVIQPDGRVESRRYLLGFIRLDPTPLPGATVVVPVRDERVERTNALANFAIVAQLVSALAAIVAISR